MDGKDIYRAAKLLMDKHANVLTWVAFVSGVLGVTLFIVGASVSYNRAVNADTVLAQRSEISGHPRIIDGDTIEVAGQRKGLQPGDTFKDCNECPEMVVIPPGSFRMGDLSGDGEADEKPVHKVRIAYSFAVGKYEVTQDEWQAVMGSNPSYFKGRRNPVEKVSWKDAKAFVRNHKCEDR